ncbi:hypothetical protein [Halococcus sp. PRR34]|uniref:hypothetical protein n=1 Tax=Halococcus sp. PRR34 TaxID=3020830 RepID=UPI0023623D4B|nr:hypothetical protein [Halococcus sp. PRR34]
MADNNENRKSLKNRFSLWLHRVLIRLGLLGDPRQNKQAQQTSSELDWEERWNILWIGFRTMLLLFVVTILVGITWIVFQPSEQTILLGTLLILVSYSGITVWTLYRMARAYRKQL